MKAFVTVWQTHCVIETDDGMIGKLEFACPTSRIVDSLEAMLSRYGTDDITWDIRTEYHVGDHVRFNAQFLRSIGAMGTMEDMNGQVIGIKDLGNGYQALTVDWVEKDGRAKAMDRVINTNMEKLS